MKKYIAHYTIAITLFFTSIASAMDNSRYVYLFLNGTTDIISLPENRGSFNSADDTQQPSDFHIPTAQCSLIRSAAENHNKNTTLIATDKKILGFIWSQFINKNDSLAKNINSILALSATCTHFNNRLEEFGNMLQCYDNETKNALLTNRLRCDDKTYWNKRRSFLLLVYAGAEHNAAYPEHPLQLRAVERNDLSMIATLFRYGSNANLKAPLLNEPVFWTAKTPTMAQLFTDNGADLNILINDGNVLSYCLTHHEEKPDLVQFYINHKVSPRILNLKKRSLLYKIAFLALEANDIVLKTIKILLDEIGDMINTADDNGKTPLDLLLIMEEIIPKKNIIALFKEYGAKTSQELKLIELAKKEEKASLQ